MENLKKNNQKKPIVIGIDFGTTYCVISIIKNKKLYFITEKNNKYIIPSVINIQENKIKIGWEAKKNQFLDPENTISSIKGMIGFSYQEIKKKYPKLPYKISCNQENQIIFHTKKGEKKVSYIIQKILNFLKIMIEKKIKKKKFSVVITVPAYFNNIQKNEIRYAVKKINLNILRLLNEPTAAAIAYGLEKKKKGKICVYDFGGGTLDVSILKISKGIFEVLSTYGKNNLGGDNFDFLIAENLCYILKIPKKHNKNIFAKLLIIAEKIKIQLSTQTKVNGSFLNKKFSFSQEKFNLLIEKLIEKSINIIKIALLNAKLNQINIDHIILVGGSCYIPLIQKKIEDFFQKKPLISLNPVTVVSQGACLHAYHLFKRKNKILLLDIIPISIGIELMGGIMEKMIPKNTKIPIIVGKKFTTFKNNQTGFQINIFQGEDLYVKNCQLLTKFILNGLPKKSAGEIKILIILQIDTDGLLTLIIEDKKINLYKSIKIDLIYRKNNQTIVNI